MQSNNLIRVSAAGAGKTWGICHDALEAVNKAGCIKNILIVSYTNRGVEAIQSEIRHQNMGVLHPRVIVMSWYKFLMSEMIKPLQTYIFEINEIKSFDFQHIYGFINRQRQGTKARYITKNRDILSNEAAELTLQLNNKSAGQVIKRLEKIYQNIYIDEIQDMAGYDLNIIEELIKSTISVTCVGDNKQATFKTNNTTKNKGKSGSNVWSFFENLCNKGMICIEQNQVSRRFNGSICNFANNVFPNESSMTTSMNEISGHDGVFLICKEDTARYNFYFSPTVLRYDSKTDTGGVSSYNFGECKGLTFQRVLIYPNKTLLDFILKNTKLKSPEKYYVAVTRPKYSLTFVVDKLPNGDEFEEITIKLENTDIVARKVK